MALKGYKQVVANLQRVLLEEVPRRAESAMYEAGAIIGGYATLMTPIDTSFLVNSQYRQLSYKGKKVIMTIGYTAKYAAAVHDKPGTLQGEPRRSGRGNYWSPNGESQFLEKAAENHTNEVDQAVRRNMTL